MIRAASLAAIVAIALAAVPATAATTITFDSKKNPDGGGTQIKGPYTEQGYTLSADSCSSGICFGTTYGTSSLDRAGAAFVNFTGLATTTLRQNDGGAFLLSSMDMADNYGDGSGVAVHLNDTVVFTFNFADGTSSTQNYTINMIRGQALTVNHLTFDLAPLLSVSWLPTTNTSGFIQFDNITVAAAPAAVPEASTWALMLAGFGLTGTALRRRRAIAFA